MIRVAFALLVSAVATAAQAQVASRTTAAPTSTPNVQLASATTAQPDLCVAVQTFAYGNTMFGITVNAATRDADCARIRKAKALQTLGYTAAGVQVMCQDVAVREAMKAAGTPCEAVKHTPE